ncbi:MAG TPA: hypothetical protein VMV49_08120 [Candidatus Deferrimicrobium sp.]|nr:hypothetical protein [Candidatus Deferrimicrobium sp.]
MSEFRQRLQYLRSLEKKVRRLLLRNEMEQAIKILKYIIDEYRSLGVKEKAKLLEDNLKNLLQELNMSVEDIAEIIDEGEDKTQKILTYIEALEKKVKRRILQGRPKDAIEDLQYIITELREYHLFEKADVIEMNLNQYITELSTDFDIKVPAIQEAPPQPPSPPLVPPVADLSPDQPPSPEIYPDLNFPSFQPETVTSLKGFDPRPAPAPVEHPPAQPAYPSAPQVAYPSSTPSPPSPSSSSGTIKDQPLSDEEVLLKKLLEIKTLLGKEAK